MTDNAKVGVVAALALTAGVAGSKLAWRDKPQPASQPVAEHPAVVPELSPEGRAYMQKRHERRLRCEDCLRNGGDHQKCAALCAP